MKIKNTDITFVVLPPAFVSIPSAPFSVLKSYLKGFDIESNIFYVNHHIEQEIDFFSEDWTSDTESLIPFLGILNKKNKSKSEYIESYYKCLFPDLFLTERSYNKEFLKDFEDKYLSLIDLVVEEVKKTKSKVIGFSSKFLQWLPAVIFAERIKEKLPKIQIVVGGWTNRQAANDFLFLNPSVDYCIWGEGEIPLKMLMETILNNANQNTINEIPHIIYRKGEKIIKTSGETTDSYVDFNQKNSVLDFSDFFESAEKLKLEHVLLPIERGRGCNWNRCKFCYLAQGYKFRLKETSCILDEIEHYIKTYNHFKYFFTDNDIIGGNQKEFNKFLDGIILIKEKHPKFEIIMAEIISKGIDIKTVEKMYRAGFRSVQVGVEAISQPLLNDINKLQNINENFFFIKYAIKNKIKIKGANIIIDTPNETDAMIRDSIDNLHKYRFLLNNKDFNFRIIPLCVSNFSRYLNDIKKEKAEDRWNIGEFNQLMPEEYTTQIDRFSLMHYAFNAAEKPLWNLFGRALDFYNRKEFKYKVKINRSKKQIHYIEYSKKDIIKDIIIDDETHWHILHLLSEKVFETEELLKSVQLKYSGADRTEINLKLEELNSEDLIYIDRHNNSVVSIISLD